MKNFPKSLISGYFNFKEKVLPEKLGRYNFYAEDHQHPDIMVIACCDSRAAPEVIFDATPGELFMVRNVANLVPKYEPDSNYHGTSAAIEFAVNELEVKNIVVLGHGRCGGIEYALQAPPSNVDKNSFINKWMQLLELSAKQINEVELMSPAERQLLAEHISIRNSISNLGTFPFVSKRVQKDELKLHGAWFDIKKGELWIINSETDEFEQPEFVKLPD